MKQLIYLLLIILLVSCQKDIDTALPNEQGYIVYNQALQCKPLEYDGGFYVVTLYDSVPWVVNVESSGKPSQMFNISTYFPSDITFDSVANLNLSCNDDNSILVSFTYNSTETALGVFQAFEIQQNGTVTDELLNDIPNANDSTTYQYLALSKNDADEWILLSSQAANQGIPGGENTLNIQTSIFTPNGDEYEVNSVINTYSGLSLGEAFTLCNGDITVVLSGNQGGVNPHPEETDGAITVLRIKNDGTLSEISLDDTFSSISLIKLVEDELWLVGLQEQSMEESVISVAALDESNSVLWTNSCTTETAFTPTSIIANINNYVLGGISGEMWNFSWDNIYSQGNNSISVCAFNYDGQMIWQNSQMSEFSSILVGANSTSDGYVWLLAKNSFNTYNNMALLKTDFEGKMY